MAMTASGAECTLAYKLAGLVLVLIFDNVALIL